MGKKIYTTKELATICSVSKKTIRHYKNMDLISPSYIDGNGYWYFDDDDLERLRLIGQLKFIELTLDEIKNFLTMDSTERDLLLKSKGEELRQEILQKRNALEIIDKIKIVDISKDMNPVHKVVEENHLEWLQNEFNNKEIELILAMFEHEDSMKDHHRIGEIIKSMKAIVHHEAIGEFQLFLEEMDDILYKYSESEEGRKSLILAHILMMTSNHSLLNELSKEQELWLREVVNKYYNQMKKKELE